MARAKTLGLHESAIQADILATLRIAYPIPSSWWERCNSGCCKTSAGRFLRFGLGVGCPDIVGCCHGLSIGVEVKRPGGKQSDEQVAWQRRHVAAGGVYILATCPREAVEAVADAIADLAGAQLASVCGKTLE
jgi:hypothetical protein